MLGRLMQNRNKQQQSSRGKNCIKDFLVEEEVQCKMSYHR